MSQYHRKTLPVKKLTTTTHLFSMQVVAVMHVLVLAQICGDLSHLCVELDVNVFLLAKQDGILKKRSTCIMTSNTKSYSQTA